MNKKILPMLATIVIIVSLMGVLPAAASPNGAAPQGFKPPKAKFTDNVAFDISPALRNLPKAAATQAVDYPEAEPVDIRPDRGPAAADNGFSGDGALNSTAPLLRSLNLAASIPAPMANFEGVSNQDNFNLFGFRVNPPDPVGDVGPNHYVEMVNLAFAVYDKQGNVLLPPTDTGSLWAGFAVEDCTDPSGDPIVVYDQFADRWLLSQFTTRGPMYYDCVAISVTGDPTGAYYRYAFVTQPDPELPGGSFFPDYPKYSVWKDSYILTTRDFGDVTGYGISVYALEKNKMVNGQAKARAVQFFLDSNVVPLNLIGDGLLPADVDGKTKPKNDAWIPIVGTQDDDYVYGATFDALNIFEMNVLWNSRPTADFRFVTQLPVAEFDSNFPCAPTSRDCLPQPGITNPAQYLDILSYRQRPTYRLAYRNFGTYESFVTSQSVEAAPGVAGMRWYEIRRVNGVYSLYQQGTYAPSDGVHRWMGSVAMDWQGNMALGYSVVNGVDVFPGIRYTGRLAGDPLGGMGSMGEGVIVNGTGVQRTTNSRWGDYTSLNVDPVDDCTFWYVNEYYTLAGQLSSTAGWQTRIASFKLPGCHAK
jgi:hypothetical protein